MFDDDLVCRAIVHPKCAPAGVFDPESYLKLRETSPAKTHYVMSVGSRYLLKDEDGAHRYGCASARITNSRQSNPTPENRCFYIGFYDLYYGEIVSINSTYYDIAVVWQKEEVSDAHFHISFVNKSGGGTHAARRHDRMAAISLMFARCIGPYRSLCPEDVAMAVELNDIDLPIQGRDTP